jgi:hypothetical protein
MDEKHPYTGMITDKSKLDELKKKVTSGEEPMKNRPGLAKGPTVIKDLIKACWKTEKKRPSIF